MQAFTAEWCGICCKSSGKYVVSVPAGSWGPAPHELVFSDVQAYVYTCVLQEDCDITKYFW